MGAGSSAANKSRKTAVKSLVGTTETFKRNLRTTELTKLYVVGELLGRGGFADVFTATRINPMPEIPTTVAVKCVDKTKVEDIDDLNRELQVMRVTLATYFDFAMRLSYRWSRDPRMCATGSESHTCSADVRVL